MKRKVVITLAVLALLMAISVQSSAVLHVKAFSGGTVYIRGDGSIEPANAPIQRNGDLYTLTDNINVGSGLDGIRVERSNMTLEGADHVVQGGGTGRGIYLYIDSFGQGGYDTAVSSVTIRNTGVQGFADGIVIYYGYNDTISRNRISDCVRGLLVYCGGDHYGNVYSSRSIKVAENEIEASSCGVEFANSLDSTVSRNNITATNGDAVRLSPGIKFVVIACSDNHITENNITANNGNAVNLTGAVGNTFDTNIIRVSNGNGANLGYLQFVWNDVSYFYYSSANIMTNNNFEIDNGNSLMLLNSSNNVFYHNNFVNGGLQVYEEYSVNTWDNGYPSGGNYWSDYPGVDMYDGPSQNIAGSDGIGDTPYVIDANNIDHYPLMSPWTLIITATVDFQPATLNLGSKGKQVTCYIELPEGNNVANINVTTIKLNVTVSAELKPTAIGDYDNDTIPDLMVKFNRTGVSELILSEGLMTGNVTLTVTGNLTDGNRFQSSAVIIIRMSGDVNVDGKVDGQDIALAAMAFGACPGDPRWNCVVDENEDNKIDGRDIVLIALNFGKAYP